MAATEGENYDILVIPGSEITRNGTTVGHFNASITFDELNVTEKNKVLQLTNKTSIPYLIQLEGKNPIHIDPHSAVRMTIDKNTKMLKMSIINMWCSADSHPVVELGL